MMTIPARLYVDLIGKPFEADGRGPSAYDCVGLAIELQRRRGVILPPYLSDPAELHRQMAAGGAFDECRRLVSPVGGCIALLKSDVNDRHIGIMLDAFRMIHCSEPVGRVVVEKLSTSYWGRRVAGFYSVEAFA